MCHESFSLLCCSMSIRINYHFCNDVVQKVRKTAKIRKRYNQVPHLTQDSTWESNKNTIKITNKSQEVSPFPAGDHRAAMNRRESMRNKRHKKHKWSFMWAKLFSCCNNSWIHDKYLVPIECLSHHVALAAVHSLLMLTLFVLIFVWPLFYYAVHTH